MNADLPLYAERQIWRGGRHRDAVLLDATDSPNAGCGRAAVPGDAVAMCAASSGLLFARAHWVR